MKASFLNRRLTILIVVALVVIMALLLPRTERTFVAECVVTVTDTKGRPVQSARVSQAWNAYSYDLSGGEDLWTNNAGIVAFRARTAKRSRFYWYFRPLITIANYGPHASFGVVAFINISYPPSIPNGFSCADEECNKHPLKLSFEQWSRCLRIGRVAHTPDGWPRHSPAFCCPHDNVGCPTLAQQGWDSMSSPASLQLLFHVHR